MQKLDSVSETVTKNAYTNGDAGSCFDGCRINGHRVVPKPADSPELIKVVEEILPHRFNNSSQHVVERKS